MNIGIVGSRSFPQVKMVDWFIRDLPKGVKVISGGARGVDAAAAQYARQYGHEVMEILPNLDGCKERHEFTEAYYRRNQEVVDQSDLLVAFTEKESGGTWDTIKRAARAGKPFKIIKPTMLFPGEAEQSDMIDEDADGGGGEAVQTKGKGPFALKGVSLGSYGLKLKRYIDSEEWASFLAMKDTEPEALATEISAAMIDFFKANSRFGHVDAISPAPRSKRNLARVHVMDLAADRIGAALGFESVRLFQPWEKSTRGRFARHGEIEVTPQVARFVGRVVWIVDDVCTTRRTLKASVEALTSLEIHAHGLAYVIMA